MNPPTKKTDQGSENALAGISPEGHIKAIADHFCELLPVVSESIRAMSDQEMTPNKMLRSFLIAGAGKGFDGTYEHLAERYTLAWKLKIDWTSDRTKKVKKDVRRDTLGRVKKILEYLEEDLRLLGVTIHEPTVGSDFDPNYHQADDLEKIPATETSIAGTVARVGAPGFSWLDEVTQEVVKPAHVFLYDDDSKSKLTK